MTTCDFAPQMLPLKEASVATFFLLQQFDTLFFFYKNLFYKNIEAESDLDSKNILRTYSS